TFVAKHPVTKPELERIEKSETHLSEKIDEMFETAVSTREIIKVSPDSEE
ncbi:MAG TPA: tRNA 4-thiouridine(8) synthase ThiI, partial [Lachnospiraceae bacterium]|nr:tRNA 4-thiouridine(8) synthase ThiI [Lachnospiraceae bacterium]